MPHLVDEIFRIWILCSLLNRMLDSEPGDFCLNDNNKANNVNYAFTIYQVCAEQF